MWVVADFRVGDSTFLVGVVGAGKNECILGDGVFHGVLSIGVLLVV